MKTSINHTYFNKESIYSLNKIEDILGLTENMYEEALVLLEDINYIQRSMDIKYFMIKERTFNELYGQIEEMIRDIKIVLRKIEKLEEKIGDMPTSFSSKPFNIDIINICNEFSLYGDKWKNTWTRISSIFINMYKSN